jgi:hypothetical protein
MKLTIAQLIGPLALLGVVTLSSHAAASSKVITFKVPVKLQNVNPTIKSFSVGCSVLGSDGGTLAFGRVDPAISTSYAGTVSVSVTVETTTLKPSNPYKCVLTLGNAYPSPTATADWLKPKPGTVFVGQINGTLP